MPQALELHWQDCFGYNIPPDFHQIGQGCTVMDWVFASLYWNLLIFIGIIFPYVVSLVLLGIGISIAYYVLQQTAHRVSGTPEGIPTISDDSANFMLNDLTPGEQSKALRNNAGIKEDKLNELRSIDKAQRRARRQANTDARLLKAERHRNSAGGRAQTWFDSQIDRAKH